MKLEEKYIELLTLYEYKKRKLKKIEIIVFVFTKISPCFDANAHFLPVYDSCNWNVWQIFSAIIYFERKIHLLVSIKKTLTKWHYASKYVYSICEFLVLYQHEPENNSYIPVDTPRKLNVHKTLLWRLGRHINMLWRFG